MLPIDAIFEAITQLLRGLHFEIHAVYEPDERGWYCAAVDLFYPGMTFRIYFTLDESGQIKVHDVNRWYFG